MNNHRTFYEEVGRRIRDARKGRKPPMTQESLAKLVSLTRTSITNIEKGRQKFLLHTLADIAEALHVGLASLLPGDGKEADSRLDDALKHRPRSEMEWIKSTISAVQKERSGDGT